MAALPIQGIVRGDFVVHLVAVDDTDSVATVADKVAQHVVGRRLPPHEGERSVLVAGEVVDADQTIAQAGVGPLDVVEVVLG
ncbi:MAG: toluene monooxygenase [Actinomycetota bacterium]|nr:toluene monooxygenase [Actinomycetota bacterium]